MIKITNISQAIKRINKYNTLKLKGSKVFTLYMSSITWEELVPLDTILMISHLVIKLDDRMAPGILQVGHIEIPELPPARISKISALSAVLNNLNSNEVAFMSNGTFKNLSKSEFYLVLSGGRIRRDSNVPPRLVLILPHTSTPGVTWDYVYRHYCNQSKKVDI